jgi:branched-chain amino acid transport system permease protein
MEKILYLALIGVAEGMFLWLVAAGLSLIFGVLRVLNFAHGSIYMLGAYIAFSVIKFWGGNFWISLAVAPIILALIGMGMEILFFRRMYGLDMSFQLLLTFSFVLILEDIVKLVWGPLYQTVPIPPILMGTVEIFGRSFPKYYLFVIAVGILVGIGLWLTIERTNWGKIVQATASDREMSSALGVRVPRLYTGVFVLGTWLAGLGGVLSVPVRSLTPGLGDYVIIEAFVVVVIGGLGSLRGAFVGAVLIGILHTFGVMYVPVFELAIAYIAMAIVLIIRPCGIFGVSEGQQ